MNHLLHPIVFLGGERLIDLERNVKLKNLWKQLQQMACGRRALDKNMFPASYFSANKDLEYVSFAAVY